MRDARWAQPVVAAALAVVLFAWLVVAWPAALFAARIDTKVEGVGNDEIRKNIEATLSIVRDRDRADLSDMQVRYLHERAPMEIQKAVEPFGYYRASVQSTLTPRDGGEFDARYTVTLGEPVRVREVTVAVNGDGKDAAPFPDLVARFPLKRGDVLDQRLYTRAKNAFVSTAADSGYLDAKLTASVIRVHREENVADIELVLDTGPQFLFGPVQFDSSGVDERVLRSYLTFERGEPFRYHKLMAFQSSLGGAPYFSRVEARPRRDLSIGYEVPIDVKLASRRPYRFEVGVGYGTDTGPRVLFNAEFRRLNRAGHRYSGRLNLSEVEISFHAEYVMPSLYPNTHAYTIGAIIARIDPVAYDTDRLAIGPTRSQPRWGWLESIALSYEYEDYEVASDLGISKMVVGGITYRYKRADDDISPARGFRMDVGLRLADERFLSTESFVQATVTAKGVRQLNPRFRALVRADAGKTSTPSFRTLPPTVRFFAGGDNSVRGYEYQSLGPRDENGEVIGGDLLFTSSAEIEMALHGKFGLALFYDAGDAFRSWGDGVVEQGVGTGLRWRSPVGPLRLDLAFPIDHEGWKLHFTMGPDL